MGKGDRYRKVNMKACGESHERIWGKRKKRKPKRKERK